MPPPAPAGRLFLYGTLKRGFDNPWSRRLWSEAVFVGRGTVRGRLYDFGPYPALVETDEDDAAVHGEVAALRRSGLLSDLDSYEGPQFARMLRPVRIEDGAALDAWVYVFRGSLGRARVVAGGRWPVQ
ncbi:MAG: gamma-glutamylcyclotransferase family protein [Bryobacteraceae bacterium]